MEKNSASFVAENQSEKIKYFIPKEDVSFDYKSRRSPVFGTKGLVASSQVSKRL
jgi:hypothetical protein